MRHQLDGRKVYVPKGTPVFTTDPSKTTRSNMKQSQVVKVHHVLPAWRQILATKSTLNDGSTHLHFEGSQEDQWELCRKFGLPNRTLAEVAQSLESLLTRAKVESPYTHGKVVRLWLELEPEKVCWAGSGGYWREVSVTAVEVIVESRGDQGSRPDTSP